MALRLITRPGSLDERAFDLKLGPNTVGRTRENDICLVDQSLSRAHARIDVADSVVVLHDLQSKNGTKVDGARIERQVLGNAHTIHFGDVECRFVRQASTSLHAPPMPTVTQDVSADFTQIARADLRRALKVRVPAGSADRDRDKLRILLKVSQLLASPASLDALLSSVLDLAFEILDIDRAAILMSAPSTGRLEPRVSRVRKGDSTFSRSIARYVMDNGVAALFSDAKADQRLADAGSIVLSSIRTSMCAPLKPRDAVLGVLYVDNVTLPDRFNAEDLEFLSAFANQAAIAIDNAMLSEKLAAEAVTKNNLLRFFPPAAVPSILKEGANTLMTVERVATVLFSDISGYTSMSSRMKPTEIIQLLNEYFPVMAEIVFRHEGTLEKYIGDALLAVWGVPLEHGDDAQRAVRAAMEMQRGIDQLNERWAGKREIGIHIGISTGPVAAGNIGSDQYIQYAAIGDTTNVASRVCNEARRGEIVICDRTAAHLAATDIRLADMGLVHLRGKPNPTQLHRVEWK